jgi:pimeloyl-ACP methyl ester carboxylesterase
LAHARNGDEFGGGCGLNVMTMTFVLIPGAGGDGWYWHRVVPLLRAAGREAVPVDLPAADDSAGLDRYADVIEQAAAGYDHVTLVAQSMGGLSAPLVATRRTVDAVVLVNAMIPAPGETGGAWWENTGQAAARAAKANEDGREIGGAFDVVSEFFHDVPEAVTREAFARGEPAQSDRAFADPWPLPAWPNVPTRVLAGADDRLFPVEFQRRVARDRLGLNIDVLPGGHLLALSQPQALTTHLLAG